MRHLILTDKTELKNPLDGKPYVYYNQDIDKVWIFLGLKWILEEGMWDSSLQWASDGVWKFIDKTF